MCGRLAEISHAVHYIIVAIKYSQHPKYSP